LSKGFNTYLKQLEDLLAEANVLIDSHNILVDERDKEEVVLRDDV